jgi:hypothetical protein
MADFIQIVPVTSEGSRMPSHFFGLEKGGRLWFGRLEWPSGGSPDGGPSGIRWHPIDDHRAAV